jgi:pimeloyl-ACP methyl ester carboxylesterase
MTWLSLVLALSPSTLTVSHRKIVTRDGAALAAYRFETPLVVSDHLPVVMVPDIGLTKAAFDFEGRGLARALGVSRTVFVLELRGQGKSDAAVALEPLALIDFPDAIAALGLRRFDLVVHGWLGAFLLAVHGGDTRIRRVVAMNTPVNAEMPSALVESFLVDGGRFSTLASSPGGALVFHQLFALWSKLPRGTESAFLSTGTRDVSRPVAAQLLAWMRTGDYPIGNTSVTRGLKTLSKDTLLLLALADGFAPPELSSRLRDVAVGRVQVRLYNRAVGFEDFSHLSMLLGIDAPTAVFAQVITFLDEAPKR